ncbi:MAG TPA: MupA/Atu3671 family FMN-dependent luciferase-like monooxygenase, partial [Burkholderiaceae bacterium]
MTTTPTTLACCFIGEGTLLVQCAEAAIAQGHAVRGVVSSAPAVVRWCDARGIPHIAASQDQVAFLGREPFDYLFSIINHAVCAPEVLALPRRAAINFHDSLLPRYAGFNVTSWAILSGEASHGVTWHEMSERVDAGRILKQREFAIAADDTAFTLAAKCYDAGAGSFAELLRELAEGTSAPRAQDSAQRSYFARQRRPAGGALIAWDRPAAEMAALVRALNFGPDANPFAVPKCRLGDEWFVVADAAAVDGGTAAPGTLVAIEPDGITVATATVPLRVRALQTLTGVAVSPHDLALRNGWRPGVQLARLADDAQMHFAQTVDRLAKHEAFWVRRLIACTPYALAQRPGAVALPGPRVRRRFELPEAARAALHASLPGDVAGVSPGDAVIALFGVLLGRLGDADATVELGYRDAALREIEQSGGVPALWSPQVPLRLAFDARLAVADAIAAAGRELAIVREHGTYLRDVAARQPALRASATAHFPVRIGVADTLAAIDLLADDALVFGVEAGSGDGFFDVDPAQVAPDTLAALTEQFEALLAGFAQAPATPLAQLPLITAAQRQRLLVEWNDTAVPIAPLRCVNELIAEQMQRTPDATALVFRDAAITYRELGERTDELARELRSLGIGPDVMVGLCAERSIEMVVGMVAILKAGGAYVPMDPQYPAERLAMMLEDSNAPVLLTQRKLAATLPPHAAKLVLLDAPRASLPPAAVDSGVTPENLAYVIFTSGSTGRPKGVMIEHRNVANFFVGMDASLGHRPGVDQPGVWLAVTSISFDISVLELLWTLARGFKVVIQPEAPRAAAESTRDAPALQHAKRPIDFSLFFFAADAAEAGADGGYRYRLLLEGAKYADRHGFSAVWTPERHFHAFGGLYPNPSITSAAIAVLTERLQIRAGSVVLPLHSPLRVAEEWSVVDNLSRGRVGLSFASGWHANDFAFAPDNFADRKKIMFDGIATVKKLWRGEAVPARSGNGSEIEVKVLPRPIQTEPPMWVTAAGSPETFRMAGQLGANCLTNMLGQNLDDLAKKIATYRAARREHGHAGEGSVCVMLHTFVGTDLDAVRETVRVPFTNYLKTSTDLIKQARWEFPAFRQAGQTAADGAGGAGGAVPMTPDDLTPEETEALMAHAFERYFKTSGLFGTPQSCLAFVDQLKGIGVDEIACLIDFGVASETVLENLVHLNDLRERCNAQAGLATESSAETDESIAAQLRRHRVTHFQSTPSMARMVASEPDGLAALRPLRKLLLGGEALPPALARQLADTVAGDLMNMYGPTETTVWSSCSRVSRSTEPANGITIGRPIANTEIYLLDRQLQPVPIGVPGELLIGGAGVVRGYLD